MHTTPTIFQNFVRTCMEQFSGMDWHERIGWMWKNSRETHDTAKQGIQTNYYGTKNVIEALLPLLMSSSDGRIVNVSSGFGLLRVIQFLYITLFLYFSVVMEENNPLFS